MHYMLYVPFYYAITGSLETFASHAVGRGDMRDCGLYFHRCILLLTIALIPVFVCFLYTETILIWIGMDPEVSKIAHIYVVNKIPGDYFSAILSAVNVVFSVTDYAYIGTIINVMILPVHFTFLYVFIIHYKM